MATRLDGLREAQRRIEALDASTSNTLVLYGLPISALPASLSGCAALAALDLGHCKALDDLGQLVHLTALRQLSLQGCFSLTDFGPLAALTTLQSLDLSSCRQLSTLAPLTTLTSLQTLYLSGCRQVETLAPLTTLSALEQLDLQDCRAVRDLRPLATLTALRQLDLTGCHALDELRPLATLSALEKLDLAGCPAIDDITPLARLTALQSLDLSGCPAITDLRPLAGLAHLQSLQLNGCHALTELAPLATLGALRELHVSRCHGLRDLAPLSTLTELRTLDLSDCPGIEDLSPLAHLGALETLYLNECHALCDLTPLAALTRLHTLHVNGCTSVRDLAPLASLSRLRTLYANRCHAIEHLQPLAAVSGLHHLNLNDCPAIADLGPLARLDNLHVLKLFGSIPVDCAPGAAPLEHLHALRVLVADRLLGPPPELASRPTPLGADNALPRIRAWQRDLAAGEADNSTVKVFVLGNGTVGKTQLCRRLNGQTFDPTVPSTHGIHTAALTLPPTADGAPPVELDVWDFGGQDVYLGTHALFLDERAVYVLAWTPATENFDAFEQAGVRMCNRTLAYWLAYILSLAGPHAPVIVAQTQADALDDERAPPLPPDHGFIRLRTATSSARRADGLARLVAELREATHHLLHRHGKHRLPASWVAVTRALADRRGERMLTPKAFTTLMREHHASAPVSAVVEYLHRRGMIFWRHGAFGERIVLDLPWALTGVYTVLERTTVLPALRRRHGRFTRQELAALAWRDRSEDEHRIFLDMMTQCDVCFPIGDDTFIAPAALPDEDTVSDAITACWGATSPDTTVTLHYRFMHDGVLRGLLCHVGRQRGDRAIYWSEGVCDYDEERETRLRVRAERPDIASGDTAGRINIDAAGPAASRMVQEVVDWMLRSGMGETPQIQHS